MTDGDDSTRPRAPLPGATGAIMARPPGAELDARPRPAPPASHTSSRRSGRSSRTPTRATSPASPPSGQWSALLNLAHVGRHHEVMLERLERVLAEDAPAFPPYRETEDARWAEWEALAPEALWPRLSERRAALEAWAARLTPAAGGADRRARSIRPHGRRPLARVLPGARGASSLCGDAAPGGRAGGAGDDPSGQGHGSRSASALRVGRRGRSRPPRRRVGDARPRRARGASRPRSTWSCRPATSASSGRAAGWR